MSGEKIQGIELQEIKEERGKSSRALFDKNVDLLSGVKVNLTVRVGEAELTIKELFNLHPGSVLPLEQEAGGPVDVLLDGKVIARGTLVAVDDNFGVSIADVLSDS